MMTTIRWQPQNDSTRNEKLGHRHSPSGFIQVTGVPFQINPKILKSHRLSMAPNHALKVQKTAVKVDDRCSRPGHNWKHTTTFHLKVNGFKRQQHRRLRLPLQTQESIEKRESSLDYSASSNHFAGKRNKKHCTKSMEEEKKLTQSSFSLGCLEQKIMLQEWSARPEGGGRSGKSDPHTTRRILMITHWNWSKNEEEEETIVSRFLVTSTERFFKTSSENSKKISWRLENLMIFQRKIMWLSWRNRQIEQFSNPSICRTTRSEEEEEKHGKPIFQSTQVSIVQMFVRCCCCSWIRRRGREGNVKTSSKAKPMRRDWSRLLDCLCVCVCR